MSQNEDNQKLAVIDFIKSIYIKDKLIPLYDPRVVGNEKNDQKKFKNI